MTDSGIRRLKVDELSVSIYDDSETLGRAAAEEASKIIEGAIVARGHANIVLATGNSQNTFLAALCDERNIDWKKVSIFHLDEYVGIGADHPASFPNSLHRSIVDHVRPSAFYALKAAADDAARVCQEYEALLRAHPADLYVVGIGENGHLAFNDPPGVDFEDPAWVKVVKLAPESRQQQVNERHFVQLDDVPTEAITVTIPAILSGDRLLVIVPERRKAQAVKRTLHGPITPDVPSTVLRRLPKARLFLDRESAALI